jgi:hypothetical protein
MDATTIALFVLALCAVLAVRFAPGRNAALGAWSMVSWSGKRRRLRAEGAGGPAGKA